MSKWTEEEKDFLITYGNEKSKIRLERFQNECPYEYSNLILIDNEKYKNVSSYYANYINFWEDGKMSVSDFNKNVA